METDAPARAGRPRPWLIVALAVVGGFYLLTSLLPGKSAGPAAAPSKPRVQASKKAQAVDPADLDVRLEDLKQPRPDPKGSERNPFRFYVPPPPPPPVAPPAPLKPVGPPMPVVTGGDQAPIGPPPPPPIPLKFIALMEGKGVPGGGKIASFSDCRSTFRGREGDIIAGQYRLVRIGLESVVMEYVDGRGRTTIRMSGQECVGK